MPPTNDSQTSPVSGGIGQSPNIPMGDKRPPTLGEHRVGISFNPGGHSAVNEIKRRAADMIDCVNALKAPDAINHEASNTVAEFARLKALAITHIEDAAMWAVKAATKPEAPDHFFNP